MTRYSENARWQTQPPRAWSIGLSKRYSLQQPIGHYRLLGMGRLRANVFQVVRSRANEFDQIESEPGGAGTSRWFGGRAAAQSLWHSMQVGPSRDAGWPPLGLVSWHGPSGERFAIEHRVSASDVIRQLEATGLSREHPGRAFSEWPTILSERALADASAFQVSRWRGGRYGCAKVGHACVPGSPRFGTMPKRA
jgi:hypothetical protein